MKAYIGNRPSFKLRQVLPKNEMSSNVYPFNHNNCYYFFSSRYAFVTALKASGLSPGEKILVPSYNCGVEIDPIISLNLKPVFYRVKKDLSADLDDLVYRITDGVKAIVIIHFLGFPQPLQEIKKICDERNLLLIEDCAHALLSMHHGKYLGSFGDISTFSLYKSLPIPNGGALVINDKNIKFEYSAKKASLFSTCYLASELMKLKTCLNNESIEEKFQKQLFNGFHLSLRSFRFFLVAIRKIFKLKGLYLARPDSHLFNEHITSWGMSVFSENIMKNTDFEKMRAIRRNNFEYLLKYFLKKQNEILFYRDLPDGVCPLIFPLIMNASEEREKVYITLKSRGVITHPWWDRFHPDVPWKEFPDAVFLKERLFGLPIHQDLTYEHLDHVISEFEKAYRSA